MELATTRNHKEVIELLNDYDKYKCALHTKRLSRSLFPSCFAMQTFTSSFYQFTIVRFV